jgi:hypothetical protein
VLCFPHQLRLIRLANHIWKKKRKRNPLEVVTIGAGFELIMDACFHASVCYTKKGRGHASMVFLAFEPLTYIDVHYFPESKTLKIWNNIPNADDA